MIQAHLNLNSNHYKYFKTLFTLFRVREKITLQFIARPNGFSRAGAQD
jgi:hypothetical protein